MAETNSDGEAVESERVINDGDGDGRKKKRKRKTKPQENVPQEKNPSKRSSKGKLKRKTPRNWLEIVQCYMELAADTRNKQPLHETWERYKNGSMKEWNVVPVGAKEKDIANAAKTQIKTWMLAVHFPSHWKEVTKFMYYHDDHKKLTFEQKFKELETTCPLGHQEVMDHTTSANFRKTLLKYWSMQYLLCGESDEQPYVYLPIDNRTKIIVYPQSVCIEALKELNKIYNTNNVRLDRYDVRTALINAVGKIHPPKEKNIMHRLQHISERNLEFESRRYASHILRQTKNAMVRFLNRIINFHDLYCR